jgi:cation:H+ antiporter
MGVALLLALRFPRWGAWALLGLFAVQFAVTGTAGRTLLVVVYGAIAVVAFVIHRRQILPTVTAPFRERDSDDELVPA